MPEIQGWIDLKPAAGVCEFEQGSVPGGRDA